MNIATLLGALSGMLILAWAITSSTGNLALFVHPEGIAVVAGGVLAATFISYPLMDVVRGFAAFVKVLRREHLPVDHYIATIHQLAQQAVAGGNFKLEKAMEGVENYFLRDALRMVVDRYPAEKMAAILDGTIEKNAASNLREADMFRMMAKYAPAFGMLGTLIGLIDLFQNLSADMQGIGPAMAMAMLTTFYGILLANLIFSPISVKLERRAEEEVMLMELIKEGMLMVLTKTPPGMVMDGLNAYTTKKAWKEVKVQSKASAKT